jgi:menaquinone-dependent protoporphyrinogen oxidase
MRVLIAFGSKRGGTAGLADMIGDVLREAGSETVVSPANGIYDLAEFDAVIVVGALYSNRWHRDARRFVRRNTAALRELPVWLVSSGPLDDSAEHKDIPPTKQVAKLANRIGARGHATFGGRLSAHATGFPASALAKTHAGDWRSPDHVRRWAESLSVRPASEGHTSPSTERQIMTGTAE